MGRPQKKEREENALSSVRNEKKFFEKLATFIVDKRNLFFFLYIVMLIFCVISTGWVSVCNDITAYLSDETETKKGLKIVEEELTMYGTARVMVSNITADIGESLAEQIGEIEGVSSVTFDRSEEHFKESSALFDVTFAGETADEISEEAMVEMKALLEPYTAYINSDVGYSLVDMVAYEMLVILIVAVIIIFLVLLMTSRSYAELPVLLMTFGAAAVMNMGTNYWFGEISFVSNSVAVVLQLALAIDYAIILLHRYIEEKATHDTREACIIALANAIPAISSSSLTTISGLLAMTFMQFKIGYDLGIVLIKAIFFSLLSVFTLMPGLLMLFANAIEKTKHRSFIPRIDAWGRFVYKTRRIGVCVFLLLVAGGFYFSMKCPFSYSYNSTVTARMNDSQVARVKIEELFGAQNMIAVLVPGGDYESEKALIRQLEAYDEVTSAMGLASIEAMDGYTLTDKLTPRQFSEMTDMDYEVVQLIYAAYAVNDESYGKIIGGLDSYGVPLIDMFLFVYDQVQDGVVTLDGEMGNELDEMCSQLMNAKKQMQGENYSCLVAYLDLPEDSEETFAFLDTIHREAEKYYDADQVYLMGNSTSAYDLAKSFERDNILVSVLSIVFVIIVLLITFRSVGLPVLLILVIQGSIWLNFSVPALTDTPLFFLGYLIVTAIQMGANIDYAIVISTWYAELKEKMSKKEAIIQTLTLSFPTVMTSGVIMASSGLLIGMITTEPVISVLGVCVGRGTVISMVMVMLILPQLLVLGDALVEKTRFSIKTPELVRTGKNVGTMFVNGHVRGKISGVVDANMYGVIHGEVSAMMDIGAVSEENGQKKTAGPQESDSADRTQETVHQKEQDSAAQQQEQCGAAKRQSKEGDRL
ncbi:MAG: MMPL family transporter [Eubacteriales bacterium]|nr:MMPL family transporter [Eubacteriales bacterium]